MDQVWGARKIKGKLVVHLKEHFISFLSRFEEGTDLEVIVRKKTKKNSRQEQRYYRGVIIPFIANEIGHSNDMTHSILQPMFFKAIDEKGFEYIRSTSLNNWTTVEWEAKVEEIRKWSYEFLGIVIPLPNEITY